MKEFNYKLPRKANQKKRAMISISVCALSILIAVSYAIFIVINKDRFINTEVAPFTVSAPETCFNFDEGSGEIVGYYSHEGNVATAPACPMNVKVPSTIDGHTVTKLGGYLFNGLGFTAIEIPNTITSIGAYALANNNIRDLVIPNSVTSIGEFSFNNSGIENLTLSSGLTIIPNWSFANNKIKKVILPSSVVRVEESGFRNNNISELSLNEGLVFIGNLSFGNNKITDINIPSTVNEIQWSFNGNLVEGDAAFIKKPNGDGTFDNTTIVSYAGSKKENVVIPEGIIKLDNYSFHNVDLVSVSLPSSLKIIGPGAFQKNLLTTISIPSSVNHIGVYAFSNNFLIPSDAIIFGRNADGTPNTTIVSYGGTGGNVVIPSGTEYILSRSFISSNITSLTIPSTVKSIASGAFANNQLPDNQAFIYNRNADGTVDYSSLNSYGGANKNNVSIPASANGTNLLSIESEAFYATGITGDLTIPNTVKTIGTNVAYGSNINTLVIPDSVIDIKEKAFNTSGIKNLTIGSSVQNIGDSAFYNNNFTTVTIPASVMTIGNNAFNVNPLTEVRIKGKSSPSNFTSYGTNVFGWKAGYSDANITWNAS